MNEWNKTCSKCQKSGIAGCDGVQSWNRATTQIIPLQSSIKTKRELCNITVFVQNLRTNEQTWSVPRCYETGASHKGRMKAFFQPRFSQVDSLVVFFFHVLSVLMSSRCDHNIYSALSETQKVRSAKSSLVLPVYLSSTRFIDMFWIEVQLGYDSCLPAV